jgi:hypothetical protein
VRTTALVEPRAAFIDALSIAERGEAAGLVEGTFAPGGFHPLQAGVLVASCAGTAHAASGSLKVIRGTGAHMTDRSQDDLHLTRRAAGALVAAGGAALLAGRVVNAQELPVQQTPPPALTGNHQVVPLPFDPKALKGLSERLVVSHHENNYGGAVRNLNRVEHDLAAVTKDTPGFQVFGLQDRALLFRNSKALHELYFANLGGDTPPATTLTVTAWSDGRGSVLRSRSRS